MRRFRLLALPLVLIALAGCDDFERSSFKTLSASKVVVDTAQSDYESGAIPKNNCSYSLINSAKGIQIAAVNALAVYDAEKKAGKNVATQTTLITTELIQLAPVVVKIESLIANPSICAEGAK